MRMALPLINGDGRPGPTQPLGIAWPNLGLAAAVASAPSAVSIPAASGSAAAPFASSVPHRARVSGRAIRDVSTPSRQGQWARHLSQYPPPASPRGVARAVSTPTCRPGPIRYERTHERTRSDQTPRASGPAGRWNGPMTRTHVPPSAGWPVAASPGPRLGRTASTAPPARPFRTRPGPVPPPLGATALANAPGHPRPPRAVSDDAKKIDSTELPAVSNWTCR